MHSVRLHCRGVLFDLDGVLVDSQHVVDRTWKRWMERHGLHLPDLVRRAHGRRSIETVREVAPLLPAEAEVAWLTAAELADTDGLRALPGAAHALDALSDTRRAIVTSGSRQLALLRLRHVDLAVPAVLVGADDVQAGKPAPDGYLLAARRLGIDPADCVVIEDTPAGIAAGRAAGATVLAVATTFPPDSLKQADVVVPSLALLQIAEVETHVALTVAADADEPEVA
ncbi:MAG: HAD-IA family hydrolase [Gemmatimonadaceae bacterium]